LIRESMDLYSDRSVFADICCARVKLDLIRKTKNTVICSVKFL